MTKDEDFTREIVTNVACIDGGRNVVLKCGHEQWWAAGPPENATTAYCSQCLHDFIEANRNNDST
jgi:hypothetical protein